MPIFMRSRSGCVGYIVQLKITGIAANAINKGNIAMGKFLNAKKIKTRINIVPNLFGIKTGFINTFNFKLNRIHIATDLYLSLRFVPVLANVVRYLPGKVLTGRISIKEEHGIYDEPAASGV